MSQQTNDSSRLGVEEIIAVISVLILATIFIGYYLWPDRSDEKSAPPESAASVAIETPASTGVAEAGNEQTSPAQPAEAEEDRVAEAPAAPRSPGESAPTAAMSEHADISAETSKTTQTVSASAVSGAHQQAQPGNTALVEATLKKTGPASPSAAEDARQAEAEPAGGPKSSEISDPVITYLDRDRLTNELVISGVSPETDSYVALLINGVATGPIKLDAEKKWRYRFKAGAGEYYVRIMSATEKGPVIREDALPTLYNISLAPVTPESAEAGAEISLLSGEFRKVRDGETLVQIAQQARMRPEDLRLINGLSRDKALKAGDVLFIPTTQ